MIIAPLGGLLGLGIAVGVVRLLLTAAPLDIPRIAEMRIDDSILFSALTVCASFVALSAAIGAMRLRTKDVIRLLRDGPDNAGARRAGRPAESEPRSSQSKSHCRWCCWRGASVLEPGAW